MCIWLVYSFLCLFSFLMMYPYTQNQTSVGMWSIGIWLMQSDCVTLTSAVVICLNHSVSSIRCLHYSLPLNCHHMLSWPRLIRCYFVRPYPKNQCSTSDWTLVSQLQRQNDVRKIESIPPLSLNRNKIGFLTCLACPFDVSLPWYWVRVAKVSVVEMEPILYVEKRNKWTDNKKLGEIAFDYHLSWERCNLSEKSRYL